MAEDFKQVFEILLDEEHLEEDIGDYLGRYPRYARDFALELVLERDYTIRPKNALAIALYEEDQEKN